MRLTIQGCKSTDRAVAFGRLNLICGANEIGKSALSDAIRFCALGFVPSLGKRLQDTSALLRGREMRVRLQVDDLHSIERTLLQEADGGYKTKLTCSWLGKGTPQSKLDGEVLRLFGASEIDAAEMLDIRELLKVSPNQRAARIEQLLAAGAADPQKLLVLIAESWWRRLAGQEETRFPDRVGNDTDGYRDGWTTVKALVPAEQRAAVKETGAQLGPILASGGLKALAEHANERKREANAAVAKKRAARDELQTRLAGVSEAAADDVQRLETQRDQLQREVGGAEERVAAATARSTAIAAADTAVRTSGAKVEAAQRDLETAKANQPKAIWRDSLAATERELDTLQQPAAVEDATVATLEAEAADLEARARAVEIPELRADKSGALSMELTIARDALKRAQDSPWRRVHERAQRIAKLSVGTGERIKELRAIADELRTLAAANVDDVETLATRVRHHETALAQEREQCDANLRERTTQQGIRSQLETEAQRRRDAAAELRTTGRTDYNKALASYSAKRTELIAQRDLLRGQIETAETTLRTAQQTFDAAMATYNEAVAKRAGIGEAPETVTDDLLGLRVRLDETKREIEAHQAAAARRKELADICAELERDECYAMVYSALEWAIVQVRARSVSEASTGLVSLMREFFVAAGRSEEPFFYAQGGKCDIGWRTKDGQEIVVAALNRAAFTLFTSALTASIAIVRAPTVKIVMVEGADADGATLGQLLRGFSALASRLTCVLVETPHTIYLDSGVTKVPDGWSILRMNGEATAEAAA